LGGFPFLGINKRKDCNRNYIPNIGIKLLGSWYSDGAVEKSKDG